MDGSPNMTQEEQIIEVNERDSMIEYITDHRAHKMTLDDIKNLIRNSLETIPLVTIQEEYRDLKKLENTGTEE